MTRDEAQTIVETQVMEDKGDFALVHDATREFDKCFAFYYQSKKFIETGLIADMHVGHGPIIVSKASGQAFETGSAFPTEHYVEAFENTGDPLALPTRRVKVTGWREGAKKVSATQHIKAVSGLGLKDSKSVVDNAMECIPTIFSTESPAKARETVKVLSESGFECRQVWSKPDQGKEDT